MQSTSHGQFNPGITIHAMVFHGLPPLKAFRSVYLWLISKRSRDDKDCSRRYIVAQIFGAYIACLLVYIQYKQLIHVGASKEDRARRMDLPI